MKTWTVQGVAVTAGITVTAVPYPHVGVGVEGRGRWLTRVRLEGEFPPGSVLDAAGVAETRRGVRLLVPPVVGDTRALVLVDVPAGYRGGTTWTAGTGAPCPLVGGPAPYRCPECGRLAPLGGEPVHGPAIRWDGWESQVRLVAEGHRAQGDAGRMGGHVVRLIVMERDAVIRVVRSGRLYGADSVVWIRWSGERLIAGPEDEVQPPDGADVRW